MKVRESKSFNASSDYRTAFENVYSPFPDDISNITGFCDTDVDQGAGIRIRGRGECLNPAGAGKGKAVNLRERRTEKDDKN